MTLQVDVDGIELTPEERRLRLEEDRLALETSFARKWLPTVATMVVGVIGGAFSVVQYLNSLEETERAGIETKAKDEREWGFKVIEMYFDEHELFDLTNNPEQAERNLMVLAAVAPEAVKGVLDAEKLRVPPPSTEGQVEAAREDTLAAVAGVQAALMATSSKSAAESRRFEPSDFTVYVQYASGDIGPEARGVLRDMGYRVPGIERVDTVPTRLQVRYYLPEQKTHAIGLAEELAQRLGLTADENSVVLLKSRKQLPGGILEVWLPE